MILLRTLSIVWLAVVAPLVANAAAAGHRCAEIEHPAGTAAATAPAQHGHAQHGSPHGAHVQPQLDAPTEAAAPDSRTHDHAHRRDSSRNDPVAGDAHDCCDGTGVCAGHACAGTSGAPALTATVLGLPERILRQPYPPLHSNDPDPGHHPALLRPPA